MTVFSESMTLEEWVEGTYPGDLVGLCDSCTRKAQGLGLVFTVVQGSVKSIGCEPVCEFCGATPFVWWFVTDIGPASL